MTCGTENLLAAIESLQKRNLLLLRERDEARRKLNEQTHALRNLSMKVKIHLRRVAFVAADEIDEALDEIIDAAADPFTEDKET